MSDKQLAALLAREAIRDLPLRYCDYVWQNDVDGIVGLFAQDGNFIAELHGRKSTASGEHELRKFFIDGLSLQPRPYIHNHVVDLHDTNSASGRCYLDLRSASSNMDWIGAGYYADEYVKVGNAWKFQSRHFTALRLDEVPEGFDKE